MQTHKHTKTCTHTHTMQTDTHTHAYTYVRAYTRTKKHTYKHTIFFVVPSACSLVNPVLLYLPFSFSLIFSASLFLLPLRSLCCSISLCLALPLHTHACTQIPAPVARTQQLVSTDKADATLSGLYMDVCKCTASVFLCVCVCGWVGRWVCRGVCVSVSVSVCAHACACACA